MHERHPAIRHGQSLQPAGSNPSGVGSTARSLPAGGDPSAPDPAGGDAVDPLVDPLVDAAVRVLELAEWSSEEALAAVERLDQRFPDSRDAAVVRRVLAEWLGRRTSRSAPGAGSAASFSPKGAYMEYALALQQLDANQIDDAIASLERAYGLDPTNVQIRSAFVDVLKEEGLKSYSKGAVQRALELWNRVREISPGDPEAAEFVRRARAVHEKTGA